MRYLQEIFSEQLTEAVGWTIFHSIWQASLMLILLLIVLFFMKDFSARIRYFIAYSTLIFVLGWSVTTAVKSFNYAQEKQEIKARLLSNPKGMTQEIKTLFDTENNITIKKQSNRKFKWMQFKVALQNNFHVVFALWLFGVLFFLLKMAGAMAFLMRLTKRQTLPFNDYWQQKIVQFSEKLRIQKKVKAIQSYLINVPIIIGQLKPIIVFPVSLFTGLSNQEVEAIIAHELAHIKRNDYLFNIIQSVIETLFFFHPAVWIISRIIRDEREHCCDDIAVAITGDRLSYIKALASAQELTLRNPYNAVAFAQNNGGLLTRVKRLKTINNMKNKVSEGFFAASLIFLSLILLSFTLIDNKPKYDVFNRFEMYEQESKFPESGVKPLLKAIPAVAKDTIERKVQETMEEMEEVPEDLEKIVEIALMEQDEAMAVEILQSVEEALKEIDFQEIQEVAMKEVAIEMEALKLDSIISEAMKEAQLEMEEELNELKEKGVELEEQEIISEAQAVEIAIKAVEASAIILENIEMDSIIQISIYETMKALEDLDLGEIITDAIGDIDIRFDDSTINSNSESLEEMEKELMELEEEK